MPRYSTSVSLRLALIGLITLSACAPARAPESESEYLTLRNKYVTELSARNEKDSAAVTDADSLALRDLERHLRPLIGNFTMKGIADTGRINLATLLSGFEESGLPDGLLYGSSSGTRVFVTTPGLFRAWLESHFAKDSTVPRDPAAALTREEVYTPIFEEDAAVARYADLPVTTSGKRVLGAMLIDREQDYCFTCAPGTILLGVDAGNRIVVIDAAVHDTIPIPSQCREAAEQDTRPQQALDAYRRTGNS